MNHDLLALPPAYDGQIDSITCADILNRFHQVQSVPDAGAINRDNQVAGVVMALTGEQSDGD
jgi:hypothetical protein